MSGEGLSNFEATITDRLAQRPLGVRAELRAAARGIQQATSGAEGSAAAQTSHSHSTHTTSSPSHQMQPANANTVDDAKIAFLARNALCPFARIAEALCRTRGCWSTPERGSACSHASNGCSSECLQSPYVARELDDTTASVLREAIECDELVAPNDDEVSDTSLGKTNFQHRSPNCSPLQHLRLRVVGRGYTHAADSLLLALARGPRALRAWYQRRLFRRRRMLPRSTPSAGEHTYSRVLTAWETPTSSAPTPPPQHPPQDDAIGHRLKQNKTAPVLTAANACLNAIAWTAKVNTTSNQRSSVPGKERKASTASYSSSGCSSQAATSSVVTSSTEGQHNPHQAQNACSDSNRALPVCKQRGVSRRRWRSTATSNCVQLSAQCQRLAVAQNSYT